MDTKKRKGLMDTKKRKGLFVFLKVIAIAYIIFFIAEYFWLSNYSMSTTFLQAEFKWNWGLATFLAQILYTLISLRMVGPTELGALLLFGKPICEVSSGLVFVPFGISQLKKETRLTIQDELPSEQFLRVHRSFIVSIDKIKALEGNVIETANRKIPIGRNYLKDVRKAILNLEGDEDL